MTIVLTDLDQVRVRPGPPTAVADQRGSDIAPSTLISGLVAAELVASTLGLTACGGGESASPSPNSAAYAWPTAASDEEASRFLLQAQFSASEAEIAAVRAQGYAAWLEAQFNAPASTTGWDWLVSRGYTTIDPATAYYNNTYPGDYMVWHQLMTSPDAVRNRIALALSEFFVVSLSGLNMTWSSSAIAAWWDLLVHNALGNYRELLEDVTLNAAMGDYLNTRGNRKEDLVTGSQPDENYAREVMQLFTIGLYQLNPGGTETLDGNGNRIETYTQSDVTNLAHVFTGYDWDQSQNVNTTLGDGTVIKSPDYTRLPMKLNASLHSTLAVSFLGTSIAANMDGATALKTALDTLFHHPNVGPFFGRQMIQRLVTSNPRPAYVARVAAAFNNNGAGVRGDLKAIFAAILLDDEARNPANASQSMFGKLREPMLRFVHWGRSFGISSSYDSWKIPDQSNAASHLGQSPLRSPSVFNFFRPGYVPPSTALVTNQKVAPEFQIVNEPSVSGYLNFMQGVLRNGLYVNAPDNPAAGTSNPATNGYAITASYANELPLATDANALVQRLNLLLCAGQLSTATISTIVTALDATAVTNASTDAQKLNRVAAAVFLIMASAEYLVQK
jgi:uncharacterized protein (DUF1800 family)